jgi:hypothetical protein
MSVRYTLLAATALLFAMAAAAPTASDMSGSGAGAAPLATGAPATIPQCDKSVNIRTHFGEHKSGKFSDAVTGCAADATSFSAVATATLSSNIFGEYTYVTKAAGAEYTELFTVAVQCNRKPLCKLDVSAVVGTRITTATPVPTQALTACPRAYYYQVKPGQTLSGTLANRDGEPACPASVGGRSFKLLSGPALGGLELTSKGDFSFAAPPTETSTHFEFDMFCSSALLCSGQATVLVTVAASAEPLPAGDTPTPYLRRTPPPRDTPAPAGTPVTVATKYQTCRGSCNGAAWKAPSTTLGLGVWDVTQDGNGGMSHVSPRKDGKPLDGLEIAWDKGSAIVKAYGKIGNVAARFPAFAELTWGLGEAFNGAEQKARTPAGAVPFDLNCLSQQSEKGLAGEVWSWTSQENNTGHVGSHYASQSNWYQKFGGKHVNCDTFQDSCKYAPLLTPPAVQDPKTGGVWSVAIDDCDVTWTGTFSHDALLSMKKADGSSVWTMRNGHFLEATVLSEAVKPASWLQPTEGVVTKVTKREFVMDLEPWWKVAQPGSSGLLYSVDVEFFEYKEDGTADDAFGLNVLFYPHAASVMADRHVSGFRWTRQDWTNPSPRQCPTCTGKVAQCAVSTGDSVGATAFTADFIADGCRGDPRVKLSKGPAFDPRGCSKSRMHVLNRKGFSTTTGCHTMFQNLTIRGVAPGSGKANGTRDSFSFEGKLQLELLLDNGDHPTIDFDLSLYVAMLTTDKLRGKVDVCRGSPYWPVLDPLGASLPDAPHALSTDVAGVLCLDRNDRTFGPTGWATVAFDVAQTAAGRVTVDTLFVQYPGSKKIFLLGDDVLPDPRHSAWWQDEAPFLNFRDLTSRAKNDTITVRPGVAKVVGEDFAFAFTPGAFGVSTDLTVTCVLRVANADGTSSAVTFREKLRLDAKLSALSRFGPETTVESEGSSEKHSTVMAMAATGGLIAVILVVGIMVAFTDSNKTLPAWVPKTAGLKKILGSGKSKGPVVKRATEGGIPVSKFPSATE